MRRAVAAVVLVLASGTAMAKPGTPGPRYFVGVYERVGRAGGASAAAVNDLVRIDVSDQSVVIRGCAGPEVLMGFGPAFEVANNMTGAVDGVEVRCLFHNDGYNRPILTCRADDGGAFTLWPLPDGTAQGC